MTTILPADPPPDRDSPEWGRLVHRWQGEMRRTFKGIRPFSLERRRFALHRRDRALDRHAQGAYAAQERLRAMDARREAAEAREAAYLAARGAA